MTSKLLRVFSEFLLVNLFVLAISSCTPNIGNYTPSTIGLSKTVSPKVTPSDTPTFAPQPTQTKQIETLLPFIGDKRFALNFNYSANSNCVFDNRGQISVFSFENLNNQFVLNDSKIDYRDPVWSPDGKWIAFVVSQPYFRPAGSTLPSPGVIGSDSIWIASANGSDMHQASNNLPSEIDLTRFSCQTSSGIASPPYWSPDGNYIAFSYHHVNQAGGYISLDYYLVDIASGQTKVLLADQWGNGWWGEPFWVDEKTVILESIAKGEGIMGIKAGIMVLSDVGTKNMHTYLISFPADISLIDKQNADHRFFKNPEGMLLVSFPFSDKPASTTTKTQIWSLDVVSSAWIKIAILNNWGIIGIGNKSTALCDPENQEIAVYDCDSWRLVGRIKLDQAMSCDAFIVRPDNDGLDFGYISSSTGDITKVYGIDLRNIGQEPLLLFDNSLFPWMLSNPYIKLAVQ
jgi:hypothetical protein